MSIGSDLLGRYGWSGSANSVPPGGAIPPGYMAVGTNPDGSTMIAPLGAQAPQPTPATKSPVAELGNAMVVDQGLSYGSGLMGGGGAGAGAAAGDAAAAEAAASYQLPTQLGLNGPTYAAAPGGVSIPGVVAGAYTGYRQATGLGDVAKNEPMSTEEQIALALPTFGTSFLYNPARKAFGSGKDADQQGRDTVRGMLKDAGFLDDKYNFQLSNGASPFNVGAEKLVDGNYAYNVNFNTGDEARDKLTGDVVSLIDPLAEVLTGGDAKRRSDLTGMFTNAALSGGDAFTNVADLFRRAEGTMGLTPSETRGRLDALFQDKKIDEARKGALQASLDRIIQGTQPQQKKAK